MLKKCKSLFSSLKDGKVNSKDATVPTQRPVLQKEPKCVLENNINTKRSAVRREDLLDKMDEIYKLQKKLNQETTKTDLWFLGYSSNGMRTNWIRYAKMEASELIESFPIKHWKEVKKTINFLNSKIELVDIWHFLMSKIIEDDLRFSNGANDTVQNLVTIFENSYIKYENILITEKNHILYCEIFEKVLSELDLCLAKDAIDMKLSDETIDKFIKVNCAIGLSFDELYKIYIGKNCLNQFRQNNGYKEGTYKKIWNGKEDNEVMFSIIFNKDNISYSSLYIELKEEYALLK